MYEQIDDGYNLFIHDGILLHHAKVIKSSSEYSEFVKSYLSRSSLTSQAKYSAAGHQIIQSTPRPEGTTTHFTGAGDNGAPGNGARVIFNMLATDPSKPIDTTFIEDVHVKDGVILMKDAPLGSYISVEVVHPVAGVVGVYLNKVPLLGTGRIDFNTDDQETISQGLTIRCTVYNSDGTGDQDPAAAFQVVGFFEMYRKTTI